MNWHYHWCDGGVTHLWFSDCHKYQHNDEHFHPDYNINIYHEVANPPCHSSSARFISR